MGEQGDIEQLSLAVPFEGAGDLGHLHQAQHALLHAGSARGAHDHHGAAPGRGLLDQAGEFFPHHRTHRAPHEAEVHHPEGQGHALQAAEPGDHRIPEAGALLAIPQAIGIGAAIFEGERIGWGQIGIMGFEAPLIGDQADSLLAVDPLVIATALANVGIGHQILPVDH